MTPGLVVDSVSAWRGCRPVVSAVSFDLRAGEVVAVIGPNGAGKTSLLDAVLGVLPLAGGSVSYAGQVLRTLRARARVFSYLSEGAEPPAEVRVATLLDCAARASTLSAAIAGELVERLGLRALRAAFAGELSRGEKRRVLLCAALCTDRPVIVLDEPLGVFDPLQMIDIRALLHTRTHSGLALLLSVHQMAEAERIASRILLLDGGCRIAFGSLDALRAQVGQAAASLEEVFLAFLRGDHGPVAA